MTSQARRMLLRLGTRQFGPPDRSTLEIIEVIEERERLETMIERVYELAIWAEVIDSPPMVSRIPDPSS